MFSLYHLSDIQGACGGENSDQQDERAVWGRDVWAEKQGDVVNKEVGKI